MHERIRVLAGVAAALGVGSVATGAVAYWAAAASLPGVALTAGDLDLTLDGQLVGDGGTIVRADLVLADVIPGESIARAIAVGNAGSVPLIWSATGLAEGGLAAHLRFSAYAGGAPSNTGTAAAGDRAGGCSGAILASDVTLGAEPSALASDRVLAVAGTEQLCLVASLPAGTPTTAQGLSAVAEFTFAARNVGAPP
jgi:hypothetical protein